MGNTGENKSYNGLWRFIEDYLPDYYHRDDVLQDDILCRFINDEEVCDIDLEWIEEEFHSDKHLVAQEIIRLETIFVNEALYEKIDGAAYYALNEMLKKEQPALVDPVELYWEISEETTDAF